MNPDLRPMRGRLFEAPLHVLSTAAPLRVAAVLVALALCRPAAAAPPIDDDWRAWRHSVLARGFTDPAAFARDAALRQAAAVRAGNLQGRVRTLFEQCIAKTFEGDYEPEGMDRAIEGLIADVRASKDPRLLFDALETQACIVLMDNRLDFAEGLVNEQQALAARLGDPARDVPVYASQGYLASARGDLGASLTHYQRALDASFDDLHRADTLMSMATSTEWIQADPANRQRRIQWVRQAMHLAPPERYRYLGIQANYQIARLLRGWDPAGAVEASRKGLALALQMKVAPVTLGVMRVALARALVADRQPEAAIEQAREALLQVSSDEFRNGAYGALAEAHAQLGEAREAMAWLARSERLAQTTLKDQTPTPEELERVRSQVYRGLGQWQQALEATERMHELAGKNLRLASERQAQLKEARFDARIREQENALLRAREVASNERRQTLDVGLGLAVLSALGFAALAIRQARQKRKLELLSAEVAQRNRELQALHQSRTRLLASACHDLRQPAHALGLLADLATTVKDERERTAKLEGVRRCSRSLTEMLGMLMDLTRLEGGNYAPMPGPVSLDELLREAELQFAADAARKGLHLEVHPSTLWVLSDHHLLRRILFNLVSNAVRYTMTGVVTVAVRPQPEGNVVLEVRDSGPGIPPDRMNDVFSEYVRLDSQIEEGLGIGLPIVQRAAALLGHPLHVQSEVGVGSSFSMELPLSEPGSITQTAGPGPAGGRNQLVLLLDDDPESLAATSGLVRQWGFDVLAAKDADHAFEAAAQAGRAPNLLITDLHIEGGIDGLEAVEILRKRWPSLPGLLVTGDLDAAVVSRAAALGVPVGYKPLSPGRLLARIEDALAAPVPMHGLVADDKAARGVSHP